MTASSVSRRRVLEACLGGLVAGPALAAAEPAVLVYAAASLTEALEQATAAATGLPPTRFSFAASSLLARQIAAGAPADIFWSADEEWMDYLASRDLIATDSRRSVLGTGLVLIASATSDASVRLDDAASLLQALGANGRLALGDPLHVPAGRYARIALQRLSLWQALAQRLAPADNVRAALEFVARGAAPLGIVYTTDALREPRVRVLARFAPETHPPVRYQVAMTRTGQRAAALRVYDELVSARAFEIYRHLGFDVPG
ncbi:MAG: molybdate ABC transporter substrate-binding protein [Steroidobacteraceae bacterium]